jgi:hypothetical protein
MNSIAANSLSTRTVLLRSTLVLILLVLSQLCFAQLERYLPSWLFGALSTLAWIAIGLVGMEFVMPTKPVLCKNCGWQQPQRYKPRDKEQAQWGWTDCPGCGLEVNQWGEKVRRFPQR